MNKIKCVQKTLLNSRIFSFSCYLFALEMKTSSFYLELQVHKLSSIICLHFYLKPSITNFSRWLLKILYDQGNTLIWFKFSVDFIITESLMNSN